MESRPEHEERKLVTVLFADLVDFTGRSDQADPEDVRAALRPYHARAKTEIERLGGTLEKFAGDAVMAVFGAPAAHEDDAERAVRAGLAIVAAVEELNEASPGLELAVRVGVETGEAIVDLGARPESGESFVTGDVVNVAARLQQTAPANTVVVGEKTFRATDHAVEYEDADRISVKGKGKPLAVRRVRALRPRTEVGPKAPLIGRDDDLELLAQNFARTVRESSAQLVTIVGEPGVGKTRLTVELRRHLERRGDGFLWRRGRCLSYGEGITFWALGEIVKDEAGILESDSPSRAARKIEDAVAETIEEPTEREWFAARLGALVGVGPELGAADRDESFTAWRRYLEAIAARAPLVLVVEDLHWADNAMLEFLEHVAGWAAGVPLLLVCTARPELFERRPGWGGGMRNSTTIGLSPLTHEDTARLISALLSQAALPSETQAVLLEHSGGNPLYAEEFVRMLVDRGIVERRGAAVRIAPGATIPVPETVQALIAARLDGLASEHKSLLHDAAVIGKEFWSGGVAAMGGLDLATVRARLHELARKEFVRAGRSSSVQGQEEFSFWHVLVRDVAYGQIPRAARGRRHEAAAAWIEQISEDRVTDHAEFLAHHYLQALQLSRSAGADSDASRLEEGAVRFLVLAGDRAFPLDVSKAEGYYRQALELLPEAHPERARVLGKAAEAAWQGGRLVEAERDGQEAIAESRASGNPLGEGEALVRVATVLKFRGESARALELLEEAVRLLELQPSGPELVRAYAQLARDQMLLGRFEECQELSEKTLMLARQHGLDEQVILTLQTRGSSRCDLGDWGGLDDLREARRLALELGVGHELPRSHNNLGSFLIDAEGPASAHEVLREGLDLAERRGLESWVQWSKAHTVWTLYELGEWDEMLHVADELYDWDLRHGRTYNGPWALAFRSAVLLWRGDLTAAAALTDELLDGAHRIGDPQVLVPALVFAASIELERGRALQAVELVREFDATFATERIFPTRYLPDALRVALGAGDWTLGEHLQARAEAESATPRSRCVSVTARAVAAEAYDRHGEGAQLHGEAAEAWLAHGFVLEHGRALLGSGRCLLALGQTDGAAARLEAARALFERLSATRFIEETDDLLAIAA